MTMKTELKEGKEVIEIETTVLPFTITIITTIILTKLSTLKKTFFMIITTSIVTQSTKFQCLNFLYTLFGLVGKV